MVVDIYFILILLILIGIDNLDVIKTVLQIPLRIQALSLVY